MKKLLTAGELLGSLPDEWLGLDFGGLTFWLK